MAKQVIVACDFPSLTETLAFLDRFTGEEKPYVKIGMELYYGEGPAAVREIRARGHEIFLDLKLHDIPNTVRRSMSVLASLGVSMTNLHAAGGSEMMAAAMEGLIEGAAGATGPAGARPALIAVTMLTSLSEAQMNGELRIPGYLEETVGSYATLAADAGMDGVVCSPLESPQVKAWCGDNFLTVTPGIRFAGTSADDQSRVATPAKAAELGSDYIVMGRPITGAADPVTAWKQAQNDFLGTKESNNNGEQL